VETVCKLQMLLVSLVALTCASSFAAVLLRDEIQPPASLGESTRGQYGAVMSCFPLLIFRCQSVAMLRNWSVTSERSTQSFLSPLGFIY
jgi:hypothetical protein